MEDEIQQMLEDGFSDQQIINQLCADGYDLQDVCETIDDVRAGL